MSQDWSRWQLGGGWVSWTSGQNLQPQAGPSGEGGTGRKWGQQALWACCCFKILDFIQQSCSGTLGQKLRVNSCSSLPGISWASPAPHPCRGQLEPGHASGRLQPDSCVPISSITWREGAGPQ